jgi:hypothetical protein
VAHVVQARDGCKTLRAGAFRFPLVLASEGGSAEA